MIKTRKTARRVLWLFGVWCLAHDGSLAGEAPTSVLTLSECLALAERQSERLAGLAEEVRARESAEDRLAALVLPRVSAKGSYTRQEDTDPPAGSRGFTDPERSEAWLAVEQPIFSGFRDRNARRRAGFLIASAERGRAQAELDLKLAVAGAYAEVLSADRRAEAVASALALARSRREELAARQEVGLARRTETLLAEAQVARHEAQQTRIAGEQADARALLGFLIGRAVDVPLADFPRVAPPEIAAQPLAEGALARRKDLAALYEEERAARAAVDVEEGGWWPSLSAGGNWYAHREGGANEDVDWDASVTAEWPLYEGGRTRAAVREARARHAQAVYAVRERRRQIEREVAEAVSDYKSSRATRESLEREAAAAEETERLLSEEFRQGIATHIERLTAQDTLLAARTNLAAQVFAERLAVLELWAVTGEFPLEAGVRGQGSGVNEEREEKK